MKCVAVVVIIAACQPTPPTFSTEQRAIALHASQLVDTEALPRIIAELYETHINDPASTELRGKPYSRLATAAYLRNALSDPALSRALSWDHTSNPDGFETTNVILDIPGRSKPDEWIVATAHYDAWFGGAVDDGSGVAVLLAAAAPLAQLALDRSVRLLFTDGEELGMVGAGRFIADFGTAGVVLAVNADMVAHIGTPGSTVSRRPANIDFIVQTNDRSYPAAAQMVDLARQLDEPMAQETALFPADGVSLIGVLTGVDLSDHAQFWLAGTPAIFPFPAGDKPSWYHTADDTPDKADVTRLRQAAKLWAAALAAYATVNP